MSNPGSTFEVLANNARLRTPANGGTNTFPGAVLTVDGDGVFYNDGSPTIGEIRFKNSAAPTPCQVTFKQLVMNGGQIDASTHSVTIIAGEMDILANTPLYADTTSGQFQINAWLTGNGSIQFYANDTAYVGDNSGWLHKFTPVLNGVLTEVRTHGWPVQVNPGAPTALTTPIHDSASGNVFVEDVGGYLYLVDSTTGAVTPSAQLDFGVGFVQGPIVDSTAGLVYVFASSDGSGSCSDGANCAAVYEFDTTFIAGAAGLKVVVGNSTLSGTLPNPMYIGAFDSTYENSENGTGNLYVCGDTGGPP